MSIVHVVDAWWIVPVLRPRQGPQMTTEYRTTFGFTARYSLWSTFRIACSAANEEWFVIEARRNA